VIFLACGSNAGPRRPRQQSYFDLRLFVHSLQLYERVDPRSFVAWASGYDHKMTEPDHRDAIAVLEDEHEGIQTLFSRVSGVDEDRRAVLKLLVQTLALHLAVEKQFLIPAIKEHIDDSDEMVKPLTSYHSEADRLLILIERRKANSVDVPGMVTELHELTDRHVLHAEMSVFPQLRSSMSTADLGALGTLMVSDHRQLLTHAHPHLPASGPLASASTSIASFIDSRRDKATDVGRSAT
jgi:iron-sulfur cluster repair protein YtfE (RIC family)